MSSIDFDFSSVILPGTNIPMANQSYTFISSTDPLIYTFREFMMVFFWMLFLVYLLSLGRRLLGNEGR